VLLGLGHATGRSDAYRRLLDFCDSNNLEPQTVLERLAAGERLGVSVRALIERFSRASVQVRQLDDLDLPGLVDALFPDGVAALADLRSVALDALVEAESAADLLASMVESITQDDVPQNPDFVRVMSLHKSKGLTSDSVYVVAAVDGVLPTIRTDNPAAYDAAFSEGRRLFYVAVTRAAAELTISSSVLEDLGDASSRGVKYDRRTIRRSGDRHTIRTIASPYVAELGPVCPRSTRGEAWLRDR
jgi:superfamily I DNA/RNA helicase